MMQQHKNTTMSSLSSAAAKGKRGVVVSSLQGPRPLPLSLPADTSSLPPRPAKKPRVAAVDGDGGVDGPPPAPLAAAGPVIVYEYTPKVIHARPDEFKALVQRLTGRQPTGTAGRGGGDQEAVPVLLPAAAAQTAAPSSSSSWQQTAVGGGDPLVLTLGQEHDVPPPPQPLDDHRRHHHRTPPVLPSPGPGGGFFLSSPGSFLFSPATMQAIQELISS